jgi:hypothetical protein
VLLFPIVRQAWTVRLASFAFRKRRDTETWEEFFKKHKKKGERMPKFDAFLRNNKNKVKGGIMTNGVDLALCGLRDKASFHALNGPAKICRTPQRFEMLLAELDADTVRPRSAARLI